jgi:hypothetical protein
MHGIYLLPRELLPCQAGLCCMKVIVKLFYGVFVEVYSLEDDKKRTIIYRIAIVLFVSFCYLV